ncbi:biliverdin-producing heme oxygenase [Kitasatospora xanthocidica]|uniref:Biliverdin-producing heme oxygenase n=1 Tax=Kitasatospora xanthocidica TaxID=83382 RepID=A0A372ZZQ4_9ACTN|nr:MULTISPECIES: biliverdin-producing heme oxygenase [Kitasatospora]RGD60860.1 biliverdin-producing heme oxygenase [Kitasatospora xanthocidica]
MPTPAPAPFSTVLRTASSEEHEAAEQSSFMSRLLGGGLGIEAYADLTGQLWYVYRALEDRAEQLAEHPLAGPFIDRSLLRTAAIERDLAHLRGPDWRDGLAPLPATAAYVARLEELAAEWPAGYLAHHYTRYLGDLSGGQIIRGIAEKTWGFERKGDGVRFYVFEEVDNPAAFKREYRAKLDAAGEAMDEVERRRVVEECKRAFVLNGAVFRDLDTRYPLSA